MVLSEAVTIGAPTVSEVKDNLKKMKLESTFQKGSQPNPL